MIRMLFWWGVAIVVGWFLLPASVKSLSAAVGGVAAELKVLPLPLSDVLKLVGGVTLLVAMWHWTTPESVRRSNYSGVRTAGSRSNRETRDWADEGSRSIEPDPSRGLARPPDDLRPKA